MEFLSLIMHAHSIALLDNQLSDVSVQTDTFDMKISIDLCELPAYRDRRAVSARDVPDMFSLLTDRSTR